MDTGPVGAAALFHADHIGAGGQAEHGGGLRVGVLHGDAQVSAGHIAIVDEVGDHTDHIVNGDGEADALDGGAGVGGSGILGGGDADDLALRIKQGAAGVARVDGGIGLDHADDGIVRGDLPVDTAYVTHGLGGGQGAQGIADGNHHVADVQLRAAADGGGAQAGSVHLQHRQVIGGVEADDLGGILIAAVQHHADLRAALHHMVIGDHIAILRQDKAGAGGGAGGGAVEIGGLHGGGDGHHAVHVLAVELAGGHGAAVSGQGRVALFRSGAVDLILQIRDLFIQLRHGFPGALLPPAVDAGRGDQAAAGHHRRHQDKGRQGPPKGLVGFADLGRLLRRLGLGLIVILLLLMPGHIGGIGIGRFLSADSRAGIRRPGRDITGFGSGGLHPGLLCFAAGKIVIVFKGVHIDCLPYFFWIHHIFYL